MEDETWDEGRNRDVNRMHFHLQHPCIGIVKRGAFGPDFSITIVAFQKVRSN